jgi:DNA adenine methylase
MKYQKPFLKWVGGKSQIIDNIINEFPKEMNNYRELFLGGGSVLFAVLTLQKEGKIHIKNKIYAYDINNGLINVYKNIQKFPNKVFDSIQYYILEYDSIKTNDINRDPINEKEAKSSKESYYYWLRKKLNSYNKESIEYSALFIIINKLCFRGIYREGPNGFNVPYGHYVKTPLLLTKEEITNISILIQDVEFICSDFRDSIEKIDTNDFVYLDPPYVPENMKSFVGYTSDGFDGHSDLFTKIKDKKNIKFVLSNSDTELVNNTFSEYIIKKIVVRRAINSKNPAAKTTEVIIKNC